MYKYLCTYVLGNKLNETEVPAYYTARFLELNCEEGKPCNRIVLTKLNEASQERVFATRLIFGDGEQHREWDGKERNESRGEHHEWDGKARNGSRGEHHEWDGKATNESRGEHHEWDGKARNESRGEHHEWEGKESRVDHHEWNGKGSEANKTREHKFNNGEIIVYGSLHQLNGSSTHHVFKVITLFHRVPLSFNETKDKKEEIKEKESSGKFYRVQGAGFGVCKSLNCSSLALNEINSSNRVLIKSISSPYSEKHFDQKWIDTELFVVKLPETGIVQATVVDGVASITSIYFTKQHK
ncbi:hypothetical protein PPL_04321 [Heterostelium album PN500]|uniref:Uncharacterized protein n=1 Tax=Heterostelium pallidum (strain ATCC 26659 / Pp 5 / PN500) TaxID=670386 RepID=D3B786_HETP5|nr:hypothetical protein PPL_04321 [Heterostelium album PN500]EFA82629.1 hypothetical protein PPL_04321 [Heterostelium album PN500]|eukprot:XP_020434746.1 hypothetical protein PPL_04321 [Heterostelium album PN500]